MELDEILTKVLKIQVDEHATTQLQRLISENPCWADEITECWELHRQMSCSKSSETSRFLSDWDAYEILDELSIALDTKTSIELLRSKSFGPANLPMR